MKLSEAIREGSKLRPVAYQERFCNVEQRGLCSDAWGAACEVAQPAVANFNWNPLNVYAFERSMDALRAIQQHYFKEYFSMPAACPGAKRAIGKVGGRVFVQDRKAILKTYDDYAKVKSVPGITSECDQVQQLAGMVDHLFYAHRWSREEIADVVEWYEQTHSQASITTNFVHYAANYR